MADSPILKIPLLSTSQANKEQTINTMVSYLERAMNDAQTLNLTSGNIVLTDTDFARFFMWRLAGVVSGRTITIPNMKRLFVVENLTGAFTVDLVRASSTLTVPVGGVVVVYCDGTNLISVSDSTITGGGGSGATSFVTLVDTFSSYSGEAGKLVKVKSTEDGLEPGEIGVADLDDVDLTGLTDGYVLTWDAGSSKWIPAASGSGGGTGNTNIVKIPVDVATLLDHTINDDLIIGTEIDAVVLAEDMRVLVKNQTDDTENGIWVITNSTPVRAVDADANGDFLEGTLVYVNQGALNGGKLFVQTEPDDAGGLTPGVTPLTFDPLSLGDLSDLGDVDISGIGDGEVLIWNATTSMWVPGAPSASFPDMTGNSGKVLAVNATEDGTEWVAQSGGGGGGGTGIPVLSVFSPGVLGASEVLMRWVVPAGVTFTLPVGLTGSKFTSRVASTSTVVMDILNDAISVGSITFNNSAAGVATFTSPVVLSENSTLTIVAPATADPDLADISMSFKGA